MDIDEINLIAVLKQTTNSDFNYSKNETNKTSPESLLSLGYKYDNKLSNNSTFIFYKKNVKKMIVICDGLNRDNAYKLVNNPIKNLPNFINYVIQTDFLTKNVMIKIKEKYKDYKKIGIAYSLGGFYLSKYIDNSFIKGYIFSGICVKKRDNIISYINNIDFISLPTSIINIDNNIFIKNKKLLDFLSKNILKIDNLNELKLQLIIHSHCLDSVKENQIPYIIF